MKRLEAYSEHAYALLRIVAGAMFAFHGTQKLFGVLTDHQPPMGSQLWIGGLIEFLGGLAIAAGFRARRAAFFCSGMMAVAYFQFHWRFTGGASFFPAVNKGELAVLYCFVFLLIACRGGGKWSFER